MPSFRDVDWVSFLFHMLSNSCVDALAPPSVEYMYINPFAGPGQNNKAIELHLFLSFCQCLAAFVLTQTLDENQLTALSVDLQVLHVCLLQDTSYSPLQFPPSLKTHLMSCYEFLSGVLGSQHLSLISASPTTTCNERHQVPTSADPDASGSKFSLENKVIKPFF
jgi:hypothetical protein